MKVAYYVNTSSTIIYRSDTDTSYNCSKRVSNCRSILQQKQTKLNYKIILPLSRGVELMEIFQFYSCNVFRKLYYDHQLHKNAYLLNIMQELMNLVAIANVIIHCAVSGE